MFNALFANETGNTGAEKRTESATEKNAEEASASTAANPLLNLWSVATAVTSTVKARADELVKSVVDTDWRTELSQFSREVGEESKTLKEKTAELVEHLPEQVVHLPEKAEEALQHLPSHVHLPKDVGQTLEGVGVAFAQLGKSLLLGTRELIDELKEGVETEIAAASREGKRAARGKSASSSAKLSSVTAKYNRFEAEVAAMQRDSSTYCDEPEDAEEYARWKAGFSLEGVKVDISRILSDNAFMSELHSRLVPIIVEHKDFWQRYFYRLHKLQQKEEQRQQLTQRAKTLQEDDVPLGWGDEDEEVQPTPPRASEGQEAPVAPAMVSEPATAPAEGEAKAAEPSSAPPSREQSPRVSRPAGISDAEQEGISPSGSAAAAGPTASAGKAAEEEPGPSSSAAADPAGGERKSLSGGGASTSGSIGVSGSTSMHVDADAGQLESEPHAETASDSSAKEWCVVSSEAQQPQPSTAAAPVEASPEAPVRPASESAVGPSAGDAAEEKAGPSSAAAAAVVEKAAPDAGSDKRPEATKKAGKGATRASGDAGEEELDEDWGNWD